MNFKKMTIGRKFTLTAAILLALISIQGGIALYLTHSLAKSVDQVLTDPLPGVYSASQIQIALQTLRGNAWKHMANSDQAMKSKIERDSQDAKAAIDKALHEYEKTVDTAEDRELFSKIQSQISQYTQVLDNDIYPASRDAKAGEAIAKYLSIADPVHKAALATIGSLVDMNRKMGDADGAIALDRASEGITIIVILLLSAIASGVLLVIFMVRSINSALMGAVNELAQGAGQIASAAHQVSSASQSLAQGSSEQAASLEETSSSSEEINSMAQQNTHNCQEAATLMTESQQRFGRTNEALQQMVVAMAEINSSSDKIAKIIKVIDEIAFQTNILALNAAVEAARAGEAGMGFAVVADEVRNLAQRCAQAAKDTAGLIEESISKSNDGKIKTDLVATEIHSIIEQSAKVKTLVDSVSAGSVEQARGIDQVTRAVGQMGQVTQQTAATAEESAAAAEELSAQSESLQEIVGQLTALVTATGSSYGGSRSSMLGGQGAVGHAKRGAMALRS